MELWLTTGTTLFYWLLSLKDNFAVWRCLFDKCYLKSFGYLIFTAFSYLASCCYSEEEARMKIYSVSTRCYFAFGCLVSEELSYKIKGGIPLCPVLFYFVVLVISFFCTDCMRLCLFLLRAA